MAQDSEDHRSRRLILSDDGREVTLRAITATDAPAIWEMHGGRVAVRTNGLGKRTVFTITLPCPIRFDQ